MGCAAKDAEILRLNELVLGIAGMGSRPKTDLDDPGVMDNLGEQLETQKSEPDDPQVTPDGGVPVNQVMDDFRLLYGNGIEQELTSANAEDIKLELSAASEVQAI